MNTGRKMSIDDKMMMCKLRLEGFSIKAIGDKTGFSDQTVLNFLSSFPAPRGSWFDQRKPAIPDEAAMKICRGYLNVIAEDVSPDDAVTQVAMNLDLDTDEVSALLSSLRRRRFTSVDSKYYKAVSDWMRLNNVYLKQMADALGISKATLMHIFSGQRFMSFEIASRIKEITGLSMEEIYQGCPEFQNEIAQIKEGLG